jgi:hypothetical protein
MQASGGPGFGAPIAATMTHVRHYIPNPATRVHVPLHVPAHVKVMKED